MRNKFDCFDVDQYEGYVFVTESGSRYCIENGCFHGRQSIEGAKISMISGATHNEAGVMLSYLPNPGYHPGCVDNIRDHVMKASKPIESGLSLILVLNDLSAQEVQRHGFVSSPIAKIEKPK